MPPPLSEKAKDKIRALLAAKESGMTGDQARIKVKLDAGKAPTHDYPRAT